MFQEFLAESRFLGLPTAVTILFFLIFVAVIVVILRGVFKRKSYDHVASLPLQDDAPDPADRESEEDTRS